MGLEVVLYGEEPATVEVLKMLLVENPPARVDLMEDMRGVYDVLTLDRVEG